MPLPALPDTNRTKELFDSVLKESFKMYVTEQVGKQKMAAKIVEKLPPNLVQKPIVIQEKLMHVLVENRNIRNAIEMQAFVNRTLPILPPATPSAGYEGIWKLRDIITDWRALPVSGHLTLGGLNAYASYRHGVLTLRSLVVGNFVESCFHASVAGWNAYRCGYQLMNIATPLGVTDVMLEAVSLSVTGSLMKIKNLFTKSRQLRDGAEAACVLIAMQLEWSSSTIDVEPTDVLSKETQNMAEPSVDQTESAVDDLEMLLYVLMIE